jgi:polyisoprenoid-binding protein YceI
MLSAMRAWNPGAPNTCCNEYLSRASKESEEEIDQMTTTTANPAATANATTTWNIDPAHSAAEFKVKHMMISNVKGKFTGLTGKLSLNDADVSKSSIEASIPVSTLNTGDEQRDAHLKSADFFDVEKFPTMTFRSLQVAPNGSGEEKVTGELTLHGVTKQVTFEVEGPSQPGKDPWGNTRIGLSATTKINRKEFGLAWNAALETGGVLVGEDVTISLDVQFIKA